MEIVVSEANSQDDRTTNLAADEVQVLQYVSLSVCLTRKTRPLSPRGGPGRIILILVYWART